MGAAPWWYRVGNRQSRLKAGDAGTDWQETADTTSCAASPAKPQASGPAPAAPERSTDGAIEARSQILFSGSTATLAGTMTNESDFDVYFSGMAPYVLPFDTDGNDPVLLGDFNSPPRENPSSGDWVMHPRASVPYRSLPVTVQTPSPRWDGTHWCASSQSNTSEIMFCNQREVVAVQIIS